MVNRIPIRIYRIAFLLLLCGFIQVTHVSIAGAQDNDITFAAIGDYGLEGSKEQAVSVLVKGWSPDFIITLGDNSYSTVEIDRNIGQYYSGFIGNYKGSFGSGASVNRFFPSVGNHDYSDGEGIEAYLEYFTLPGEGIPTSNTSGSETYYDFWLGDVHFFVINSNIEEEDGIESDSKQANWLQEQMSQSPHRWQVVYFHHAPYSSNNRDARLQWPFEDWGADAVFTAHSHTYERIMRDENNDGIVVPYFVAGTGGARLYVFSDEEESIEEGSMIRYDDYHGAMRIEASSSYMRIEFWSIHNGGTLVDSVTLRDRERCIQMYNDLAYAEEQESSHITWFTASSDGNPYENSGNLVNYVTGAMMPFTLTVDGGSYILDAHQSMGDDDIQGDAAEIFGGRVSPEGTLSYLNGDDEIVLYIFSNLDPDLEYTAVLYTHRNGLDDYTWSRASVISIMGADGYINTSSPMTDDRGKPIYTSLTDGSTIYPANNPDGSVVRYEQIRPGADGTFALLAEAYTHSLSTEGGEKGRYANTLMLEACSPS